MFFTQNVFPNYFSSWWKEEGRGERREIIDIKWRWVICGLEDGLGPVSIIHVAINVDLLVTDKQGDKTATKATDEMQDSLKKPDLSYRNNLVLFFFPCQWEFHTNFDVTNSQRIIHNSVKYAQLLRNIRCEKQPPLSQKSASHPHSRAFPKRDNWIYHFTSGFIRYKTVRWH